MDTNLKTSIWEQFGAVIDYLDSTLNACPDELWHAALWQTHGEPPERAQVWYVAYHTLFWLDLYLTDTEDGFLPPPPFLLIEQDEHGPIPERAYTKAELLTYLTDCRKTCWTTIQALTDEKVQQRCAFSWGEVSFLGLLIYNLRHVQEHTGQINMLLGQHGIVAPDYATTIRGASGY